MKKSTSKIVFLTLFAFFFQLPLQARENVSGLPEDYGRRLERELQHLLNHWKQAPVPQQEASNKENGPLSTKASLEENVGQEEKNSSF